MSKRPKIPKEIERQVFIEAGYKCAVCGESSPLEIAHIIPYSKSKDHSLENLICLCANCHGKADRNKWDKKALREFKNNPHVLRRHVNEQGIPIITTKVEAPNSKKPKKPQNLKKQIKVLSITASPDSSIFYEREQTVLLDSFAPFTGTELVLDMPDPVSSTLTELDKYLGQYQYDILIISAHGSKEGKLMFEDEEGKEVAVTGNQIAEKLQKHKHRPFIVIFSACHSAAPKDYEGLLTPTKNLFDTGDIACVIGMQKIISQLAAIDFNKGFIQSLLNGDHVKAAFKKGTEAIKEGENRRLQDQGNKWKCINENEIPQLFLKPNSESLTRNNFHDQIMEMEKEKLISADFEGAKYVERGFIGRRKELRDIMKKVLIDKESRIVIKGPGGVGKSALTTRVCANLRNEGWKLLIFVGTIRINEVINKIFDLAKTCGLSKAEEIQNRTDISWQEKLRLVIKMFLTETRVAIIFDNFEDNQEPETGNLHPEQKEFIEICGHLQNHESALFITTRYKIPGLRNPVELQDLSTVETRKMFFRFKTLSRLSDKQVSNIHQKIGANPRALELLEALSTEEFGNEEFGNEKFDMESLEGLINEALELVRGDKETGDKETEEDFTPWFINRLISYLNEAEKGLLKIISVYRLPVKSEGLFFSDHEIKRAREKLQRLSLMVYIPKDVYFAHRLTSDYVARNLFKKDELRQERKKAGKYLEEVNSYEAIYQYREADELDRAFEIADQVQVYLRDHGYVYEARELLESFLTVKLTKKNRGSLCHSIGIIEDLQGNPEKALRYFNESLEIKEKLGDISGKSRSIHHIGIIYLHKGDYDKALKYSNQSLAIDTKLEDIRGMSGSLHNIGVIYQHKGDYDKALKFFNQSLESFEKLGDISGKSRSIHNIGMIYQFKGDYDKALKFFNQSLEIFEKLGDISGKSQSIHHIGMIYQLKGDYGKALKFFNQSLDLKEKSEDIRGIAITKGQTGQLNMELKRYTDALKCFIEAYLICKKIGSRPLRKLAINDILKVKKFVQEKDYNKSLQNSGIDPDELTG